MLFLPSILPSSARTSPYDILRSFVSLLRLKFLPSSIAFGYPVLTLLPLSLSFLAVFIVSEIFFPAPLGRSRYIFRYLSACSCSSLVAASLPIFPPLPPPPSFYSPLYVVRMLLLSLLPLVILFSKTPLPFLSFLHSLTFVSLIFLLLSSSVCVLVVAFLYSYSTLLAFFPHPLGSALFYLDNFLNKQTIPQSTSMVLNSRTPSAITLLFCSA